MNISSRLISLNGEQISFNLREESPGDRGVIQQIFHNLDYKVTDWAQGRSLVSFHNKTSLAKKSLIIDAGANIGASVVYFSKTFFNSFIFSLEPDLLNWHLLELNTAGLSVLNFHGGISNSEEDIILENPGRSDWGFTTRKNDHSRSIENGVKVKCISPEKILEHPSCIGMNPLIIKIDIEGAEEFLFDGPCRWMDQFALIIIELHDWMLPFSGSSRNFIKSIARYDFDFIYRGENVFLFNRRILRDYI